VREKSRYGVICPEAIMRDRAMARDARYGEMMPLTVSLIHSRRAETAPTSDSRLPAVIEY